MRFAYPTYFGGKRENNPLQAAPRARTRGPGAPCECRGIMPIRRSYDLRRAPSKASRLGIRSRAAEDTDSIEAESLTSP